MKSVTKSQVMRIARKLADEYGLADVQVCDATDGRPWSRSGAPNVVRGEHEGSSSAYIISWEECPDFEWTYGDEVREATDTVTGGKFFAEPINSWCVAFYPTYQ